MRELLGTLVDSLNAGRPLACCRLVETRGSTPQKAGAMMLVFAEGSQAGTLGGGCVEAEVKRRALAVLAQGRAEVLTFQLDSDYGWDDGLICGGRMQVLVDPLIDPAAQTYYRALQARAGAGRGVLEALVFDAAKSQLPVPASYLFDEQGGLLACCGHCDRTAEVPELISRHRPDLVDRPRPLASHGVAYLPSLPRCRLLIVGAGHVGQAVAALAHEVDFDVSVVDDRGEYASTERFPSAERRIIGPIERVLAEVEIDANTYCLIVTRGHNHDEQALYHLAERGARYVGMIGSRRKIKMIFDDLLDAGISPEAIARVYAPVGIDIGSQSVPEIAVSIVAELVAHRNLQGEVPGRATSIVLGEPS